MTNLPDFKRAYGSTPDDELCALFNLSLSEVRRLAVQLGLAKNKGAFPGTRRMPRWSEGELMQLKSEYPNRETLDIATNLGRSVKSVVSKAHALGLKKTPEFLRAMGQQNVAKRYR